MSPDVSRSVLFLLSGSELKASSRVRGYWVATELQKRGFSCVMQCGQGPLGCIQALAAAWRCKYVIFQKRYSRWDVLLQRVLTALGRKTILDLDDAPSRINHPVTLQHVSQMMRRCSAVTVGCQNLADMVAEQGVSATLIPSCVNLDFYAVPNRAESPERIHLGWIGNGGHYAEDLVQILSEPLRRLAERLPLKLTLVGVGGHQALREHFGAIAGLETRFIDALDWAAPSAVSDVIAEFDLGLYPRLDNEFNHYKCGFKAIEYMATGCPVVASPVGAVSDIVKDGVTGALAVGEDAWIAAIERLAGDSRLRSQWGQEGRKRVESEFSTVRAAELMAAQFDRFLDYRGRVATRGLD